MTLRMFLLVLGGLLGLAVIYLADKIMTPIEEEQRRGA